MIIACIIAFNEQDNIQRCISSLKKITDRIVVVDGAFQAYPHKEWYSTDDTIVLAKQLGCSIIDSPGRAWHDEVEKRNSYHIGEKGDYYLVVDADEELKGRIKESQLKERCYLINREDKWGKTESLLRIYRHEDSVRYEGTHNCIWYGKKHQNNKKWNLIDTAYIKHYNYNRSKERIEKDGIWMRWLGKYEEEFRSKYQINY